MSCGAGRSGPAPSPKAVLDNLVLGREDNWLVQSSWTPLTDSWATKPLITQYLRVPEKQIPTWEEPKVFRGLNGCSFGWSRLVRCHAPGASAPPAPCCSSWRQLASAGGCKMRNFRAKIPCFSYLPPGRGLPGFPLEMLGCRYLLWGVVYLGVCVILNHRRCQSNPAFT